MRLLLSLFVLFALSSCSDTPLEEDGSNSTDEDYNSEGDQHVEDKDDDGESDDEKDDDGESDEEEDADEDGIPDVEDEDEDNDGINDDEDTDDDGDGIQDEEEDDDSDDSDEDKDEDENKDENKDDDADEDGIPDMKDEDDDNDGIDDKEDTDDDGDGIQDDEEDNDDDNDDGESGVDEDDGESDEDEDDNEESDDEDEETEKEGGVYINSIAWIDREENPFDMQGEVYAFNDGTSSSDEGNPWEDGKYCVSGELTGNDGDWGAGIGFDMNLEPDESKEAYHSAGNIGGFKIALNGYSPGRIRIQFIVNEPQSDNQPFLEAHLNTTMIYPIKWAQIPASWDISEAGREVENELYAVQVFVEGEEAGPFEVCIEEFEPVSEEDVTFEALPPLSGYHGSRTINDAILEREYELWKALRYRDCGDGSACIPRDEGDCISEGIGYGMLATVGFDDQEAFNKLWTYYNNHKNGANLMAWQTNACGGTIDSGAATDGDVDVAMALLQAACKWGGNYENDAKGVMSALQSSAVDQSCGKTVLKPGEGFGGCSRTNPSYYSPGYFKVFAEKSGSQIWSNMVNDGYDIVLANQRNQGGSLVSDWCDSNGSAMGPISGGSVEFGPDGSRVPWRMAIDYIWNQDDRAAQFLDNFYNHVNKDGVARTFTPNSNFRGGSAFSAIHKDSATAQEFTDAWITTAVDDETYFPGTLRIVYMLLAANRFPKGC